MTSPTMRCARIPVRDVRLSVGIVGFGPPLLVMHGGPSADMWTMQGLRPLADRHTLVFYDHRGNGRTTGAPIDTMTWDNLDADADALREHLGYDRWAVLGHSFGGQVALEYALRYPRSVTRLVLLDSGADAHWARDHAPTVLTERGVDDMTVELVRRWFHGDFTPRQYYRIFARISGLYLSHPRPRLLLRALAHGAWRSRIRPRALIVAGRRLLPGWSVRSRLGEITAPALVLAGRDDFVFPPECQQELAAGLPHSELVLVDDAGHSPQDERPRQVLDALRQFLDPPGPR
ncbi:MAG: alpha/beta hydrolase [Pseudonocardiaceae bacterium]|nr:MAG: alpha/beta hydrolase [Pseudonocardiaceae bacterium]